MVEFDKVKISKNTHTIFYQDKKIKIYLIIELDDLRKVWMVLNLAGLHIEVSKFI